MMYNKSFKKWILIVMLLLIPTLVLLRLSRSGILGDLTITEALKTYVSVFDCDITDEGSFLFVDAYFPKPKLKTLNDNAILSMKGMDSTIGNYAVPIYLVRVALPVGTQVSSIYINEDTLGGSIYNIEFTKQKGGVPSLYKKQLGLFGIHLNQTVTFKTKDYNNHKYIEFYICPISYNPFAYNAEYRAYIQYKVKLEKDNWNSSLSENEKEAFRNILDNPRFVR
ncbi:hypothetical protein acsn021_06680 [Anaerocolumna cellulosilytica]|uniref:Uncharacterized protein n=1 Tax=Anaerocolumna cellulosilytica TaxID=433286 RepID=A0A6S6QVI9_9FIRM|nr:hypothetical protein [Anaerocolumna cellulosilytica]MBB5197677.1 hypothetical protein [Anaerocolumna cellulosilytica]BCJ93099.1 hypothetical protein acsn021_06680 [Anaerocolumna cellulosilytica]